MGGLSRSRTALFTVGSNHQTVVCGRAHQIGAMALIAATLIFTRVFDRLYFSSLSPSPSPFSIVPGKSLEISNTIFQRPPSSFYGTRAGYESLPSLKIYIYEEHEIDGLRELMHGRDGTILVESCSKGQWGTQVKIHQLLLKSKARTLKKEDADFFFVPSYVKCVRMNGGLNDKEINQTYAKVLSQMPYFRLSGGRDHVFVFPSGAGAHLFRSWAVYLNRSIILTPEGDRTDKRPISSFHTWKDIIIPGNVDDGLSMLYGSSIVQPVPLSKRKHLANFLGRAQGKVGRLQLFELAKQFPDKLESPELQLSGPNKLGRVEYFNHLRDAKFCLSPRGESSWTLRFYESFFVDASMLKQIGITFGSFDEGFKCYKKSDLILVLRHLSVVPRESECNSCLLHHTKECVPVILSDKVELPFQNIIDYTEFSIKWPSKQIGPLLLEYLESIPNEVIERMIARGREVRCLWVYALPESGPCSAMLGILWELQRKVRRFHQSAQTFWLHNQSIVNGDLVEFHSWRTPLPLP